MIQIVPAIIPKSFDDLKEKALKVAPFVSTAQIDIMDGVYAPEASYPFIDGDRSALKQNFSQEARIGFELDMMVENPDQYLDEWSDFGITTFIIHFESTDNHQLIINKIRSMKKGVALAFKPSLDLEKLQPFIEQVDFIQCMGNDKIGYHGVELDAQVITNIKHLRKRYPGSIISTDIGVSFETAPRLIEAGVSKLVSGSAIYNSPDIQEAIQKLSIAT